MSSVIISCALLSLCAYIRHTSQQDNRTNIFWLATNGTLAALTLTGAADPVMVSAEVHIWALVMWWSGNTRSTLSINGGVYSSWCHLAHSVSVGRYSRTLPKAAAGFSFWHTPGFRHGSLHYWNGDCF